MNRRQALKVYTLATEGRTARAAAVKRRRVAADAWCEDCGEALPVCGCLGGAA